MVLVLERKGIEEGKLHIFLRRRCLKRVLLFYFYLGFEEGYDRERNQKKVEVSKGDLEENWI